ncbi:MAG: hypothetical protein R3E01_33835 [Pirellulaceae bacterium]|nr:hypothetical protein [Planctomycetales bacterium]
MTLRLGQWVQHGELWCQRRYSVGGCLRFGGDHPLMQLELTGQSQGILRGRRVVFRPLWNSVDYLHESNKEGGTTCVATGLVWHQVGPTGRVELEIADGSERHGAGTLRLEWCGQNGPVVVNMPRIEFQFIDSDLAGPPHLSEPFVLTDLPDHVEPFDLSDPFDPPDLFEFAEANVLITDLFEEPVRFPPAKRLNDAQAERQLKRLLAKLARYGIALEVCDHFTPRDCYRLLTEVICVKQRVYPETAGTAWIQSFSTWEFCETCLTDFQECEF